MQPRIRFLIAGNFNGYLDDGGTLFFMDLLERLARHGYDVGIEVISPRERDREYLLNVCPKWGAEICHIDQSVATLFLRNISVRIWFSNLDIFGTYRSGNIHATQEIQGFVRNILRQSPPSPAITSQEDVFSLGAVLAEGIPSAHFVTSEEPFRIPEGSPHRALLWMLMGKTALFVFSRYLRARLSEFYGRKACLFRCVPDLNLYRAKANTREFVTFINPVPYKGLILFLNIAKNLPRERFLVVGRSGLFERVQHELSNVEYVPLETDMRRVYSKTKVLIVPSLCRDTFPRVVAEAIANGIPVVANDIAGVAEVACAAAILVNVNTKVGGAPDCYSNPAYHMKGIYKFIQEIEQLSQDADYYGKRKAACATALRTLKRMRREDFRRFVRFLSHTEKKGSSGKYDFVNLVNAKKPRRFRAYDVGIVKTGTHSIAGIFSNYPSSHEYLRMEAFKIIDAFRKKVISKEEFRKFVIQRDFSGNLEMDSANYNHYYLDILTEAFPSAKFIFTIRDCYSWLDSMLNMVLSPLYIVDGFLDLSYGLPFALPKGKCKEKDELRNNFYKYIDGPLKFRASTNTEILDKLPANRSLIIRTHEISENIDNIARFIGIPANSLNREKAHLFPATCRFNILHGIDRHFLSQKFKEYCLTLMEKFFPGYSLEDFLNGNPVPNK